MFGVFCGRSLCVCVCVWTRAFERSYSFAAQDSHTNSQLNMLKPGKPFGLLDCCTFFYSGKVALMRLQTEIILAMNYACFYVQINTQTVFPNTVPFQWNCWLLLTCVAPVETFTLSVLRTGGLLAHSFSVLSPSFFVISVGLVLSESWSVLWEYWVIRVCVCVTFLRHKLTVTQTKVNASLWWP